MKKLIIVLLLAIGCTNPGIEKDFEINSIEKSEMENPYDRGEEDERENDF